MRKSGNLPCFHRKFPSFPSIGNGRKSAYGNVKFPSFPTFSLCYLLSIRKLLFINIVLCAQKIRKFLARVLRTMSLKFPDFRHHRSQPLTYTRKSPVLCALKRARTKPLYRTLSSTRFPCPTLSGTQKPKFQDVKS